MEAESHGGSRLLAFAALADFENAIAVNAGEMISTRRVRMPFKPQPKRFIERDGPLDVLREDHEQAQALITEM